MSPKNKSSHIHTEDIAGQIKVAIVGAGISGLSVANGLLKDPVSRFDVQVYERDTLSFSSERGGYQVRISGNGVDALKTVSDNELWSRIREIWADDKAEAPCLVNPKDFEVVLRLANQKLYPKSKPVQRAALRNALLQPIMSQGRLHLDHSLTSFEYMKDGQKGVKLHFKNQGTQYADILIAADGSNSPINRQVGLNNKKKLKGYTLIQSRGVIDQATRNKLPRSLQEEGAVMLLAGREFSGFASVYDPQDELGTRGRTSYTLFWSCLIPTESGERILANAKEDVQNLVSPLIDHLHSLGFDDQLPFIIRSATEHIRTGLVTSSEKPKGDWRVGDATKARVILLGDAVHPMTPGRGMGANQALTDAGKLVRLLQESKFEENVPSDNELAILARDFDTEMYDRAFKMVSASEQLSDLDLSTIFGRTLARSTGMFLTLLGWGVSLLERVGLKTREKLDYLSHEGY